VRGLLGAFGVGLTLVLLCTALELLVLAPLDELRSARTLGVAFGSAVVLAAALALLGAVVGGLASAAGLRVSAVATTLVLGASLCAGVVARSLAEGLLGGPLLAVPAALRPVVLALLALAPVAAVQAVLARRAGASAFELALAFGAVLAVPTALSAALQRDAIWGPVSRPLVALAALLYVAAIGAAVARRSPARRLLLPALGLAAALAAGIALPTSHEPIRLPPPTEARSAGPPVVLIVLDTLRADALDLGDPARSRTPVLARLAGQADVFESAVANASWTLPGHASLFTGLFVSHHRTDLTPQPGFAAALPGDIPTVAELLGGAGYRTTCVSANPIVSFSSGLARGCQRYHAPSRIWLQSVLPLRALRTLAGDASPVSQLLLETTGLNVNPVASEIVRSALRELEPGGAGQYLFLNFLDVHGPLTLPPGDERVPAPERSAFLRDVVRWALGGVGTEPLFRRHVGLLRAYYAAQTELLDAELGRLFRELEQRGMWDSALVIVTADHGEGWFENPHLPGYFGHHSAWEPAVRIPLIVKRPGQRSGTRHAHLVQQTGVLPTILEAAGLPFPPRLDDRPMGPTPPDVVLTEWFERAEPGDFPYFPGNRVGVYRDGMKYVREAGGAERLFDLRASPWEESDVAEREPELVARLREGLGVLQAGAAEATPADANRELLEKLRNLGYVH